MKISKRQLRRIIQEAMLDDRAPGRDPKAIIKQALEDSIPAIGEISQNGHARTYYSDSFGQLGDAWKSETITYQFMSTWGAHDDHTWNLSTQRARQVVLDNLIKHGAVINGRVPPMNDFGTPSVKFSLEGQPFELVTSGHRYDVHIYAHAKRSDESRSRDRDAWGRA